MDQRSLCEFAEDVKYVFFISAFVIKCTLYKHDRRSWSEGSIHALTVRNCQSTEISIEEVGRTDAGASVLRNDYVIPVISSVMPSCQSVFLCFINWHPIIVLFSCVLMKSFVYMNV